MAHFAKLTPDNEVIAVIVVNNSDIDNLPFPESEPVGIAYCQSVFGDDIIWKQTSYNNNFRREYACRGGFYYPATDVFVRSKPYPSWYFDAAVANWVAPVPMPTVPYGYIAIWSEDDQKWYFQLNASQV